MMNRWLFAIAALLLCSTAWAEPYLAIRSGQKCAACHLNPSGGGLRTPFGAAYGNAELPARTEGDPAATWNGKVNDYLSFGADLRFDYRYTDIPDQDATSAFDTSRGSLYLAAYPLPNRVNLYADHDFAASQTREIYALLWNDQRSLYLKAGSFFLPFGYRLEDDTALVRATSGINMTSADEGLEAGLEAGPWSIHLALTNGAGGGDESDTGKRLSLNAHYVRMDWRLGAGVNRNDGPGQADRDMLALFGGMRWAGFDWLAELDLISELNANTGADQHAYATLLEANRLLRPGHNLKLTLEYLEPDDEVDEDERNRLSLVWEHTPIQLLQLRVGLRASEGIPQNPQQNADLLFVQLHSWF